MKLQFNIIPFIGDKASDGTMHGEEPIEPCIGATMTDGTVYAGTSPDTGKEMYALTPTDTPSATAARFFGNGPLLLVSRQNLLTV